MHTLEGKIEKVGVKKTLLLINENKIYLIKSEIINLLKG